MDAEVRVGVVVRATRRRRMVDVRGRGGGDGRICLVVCWLSCWLYLLIVW